MNRFDAGRGTLETAVVVITLALAAPVWAQGSGQSDVDTMQSVQNEPTDTSFTLPYTWNIAVGVGTASGANPVGSVTDEDQEKISTIAIDNGVLVTGRIARRMYWRLAPELEFGYASPGTSLTETDLQGANVTTNDYGEFSFGYVSLSARVDLVDARITPFLLGGFALTFNSYPDGASSTEPGFLFGGGVDVQVIKNFFLRADVRGLRANVDAPNLSRGLLEPGPDRGALVTQVLWTVGVAVRF
ncbi:MAG: hypothetical protein PVJ49_19490 [Acidobacteriota bacterium]|jgi:opacity protein-like surface antigen